MLSMGLNMHVFCGEKSIYSKLPAAGGIFPNINVMIIIKMIINVNFEAESLKV